MFYLTIPSYYTEIHAVLKPRLRQLPFAIMRQRQVWQANQLARMAGISYGMTIRHALQTCVHLATERNRPARYRSFNSQIIKAIKKTGGQVRTVSFGSYYIHADIPASHASYYMEKVYREISQNLELRCRIGFGESESLAFAAAQLATNAHPLVHLPKDSPGVLHDLPIACLAGVGRRTTSLLFGMGIKTIKDFASLPKQFVVSLFGEKGFALYAMANGERETHVQAFSLSNSLHQLPLQFRKV